MLVIIQYSPLMYGFIRTENNLYKKHKLVCGSYKLEDKVNYNLVIIINTEQAELCS